MGVGGAAAPDAPTDGILSRPGLTGQFLGDHHDPRSIRRVALCEQPASREPYAKEPQVIRRPRPDDR